MARHTRRKQRGGLRCTRLKKYAPSNNNNDSEQSCIQKAAKMRHNAKLGCGEQGCTYALVQNPDKVIKITPFWDTKENKPARADMKENADKWYNEACLGEFLGEIRERIAPRIHQFFECDDHGYIIMEKISVAEKFYVRQRGREQLVVIREKEDGVVDHINLMPAAMQYGFIEKLTIMISNGFIHMDNHIGNLGFIFGSTDTPILFDFGFTVQREMSEVDKSWALAFSLFQIIEHCPQEEVEQTEILRVATALMKGTYTFGGKTLKTAVGYTIEELFETYPSNKKLVDVKATAAEEAGDSENLDLYVGCICYATLMGLPQDERYDHPLYETIYDIRQGKAI